MDHYAWLTIWNKPQGYVYFAARILFRNFLSEARHYTLDDLLVKLPWLTER